MVTISSVAFDLASADTSSLCSALLDLSRFTSAAEIFFKPSICSSVSCSFVFSSETKFSLRRSASSTGRVICERTGVAVAIVVVALGEGLAGAFDTSVCGLFVMQLVPNTPSTVNSAKEGMLLFICLSFAMEIVGRLSPTQSST